MLIFFQDLSEIDEIFFHEFILYFHSSLSVTHRNQWIFNSYLSIFF